MKATNHTPVLFAGAWCLLILLRFGFTDEIPIFLRIMTIVLDGILIISGTASAWLLVVDIRRTRTRLHALCLAAVLGLGGVAYGTDLLEDAGMHLKFRRLRSEYAAIVEQLQTEGISPEGILDGISYRSAAGPQLRVAFSWGGIIDNWYGVVYDPSGLVMRSNEFLSDWSNWGAPELAHVKGLFGGDLRKAKHLEGFWYLCWFT